MDWNACDAEKVPYRRIEDYVASMTKPKADQHGLVYDSQFDLKFDHVRSDTVNYPQACVHVADDAR